VLSDASLPPCAIVTMEDRESGRTLYRRDRVYATSLLHADDPKAMPPPRPGIKCWACRTVNPEGAGCCLKPDCVAILTSQGYRDLLSSWSAEQRAERAEASKGAGLTGLQFWADPTGGAVVEGGRLPEGRPTPLNAPARAVAKAVARADSAIVQGTKRHRHGEAAKAHGSYQYWEKHSKSAVKNGFRCHAHRYDKDPSYRSDMKSQQPPVPCVAWHFEHHPHLANSPVSGKPTGNIVCYPGETEYLDETGYGSDGPVREEDWAASSAASASHASRQRTSGASDVASTSRHSMD